MSRRFKIAFVSSWYPVPHKPTHGIFVKRHALAVASLHDVYALYCSGGDHDEMSLEEQDGFTEQITYYNNRGLASWQKYLHLKKLYAQGFERMIAEWGRPDVIHLNIAFPVGVFALALCKRYNIPLVLTEHWTGYLPEDGSYKGLIKKTLTQNIVKRSKIICPVSNHLAKAMQSHGLSGVYRPVPNVVDTDFFLPGEKSVGGKAVFFHLSSLDERQKDPLGILDAFALLCAQRSDVHLIMAGDGDNLAHLKSYAEQKGIEEKMEFVFQPQGATLLNLYQRAHVFVLNSRYENLPVVLLEAMSCGLPVITTNVGGISEYVNEARGVLFEHGRENLYGAMQKYLMGQDKFDRRAIRSFAESNFSTSAIAAAYDSVYKTILC